MAEPGGAGGRLKAALGVVAKGLPAVAANLGLDLTPAKQRAPTPQDKEVDDQNCLTAKCIGGILQRRFPETPNLIGVYERRVSHIVDAVDGSVAYSKSMAAASDPIPITSTRSYRVPTYAVIHAHLLTCLLIFRFGAFNAAEILKQMVHAKHGKLEPALCELMRDPHAASVIRACIGHMRLRRWVLSVQEWMGVADSIMCKEKGKLERIGLPDLFDIDSVFGADFINITNDWLSASAIMENLVSGRRQEVQDRKILSALAAWHLYPDVYVFGPEGNAEAHMHDWLVPPWGVLVVNEDQGATAPSNAMLQPLYGSHA